MPLPPIDENARTGLTALYISGFFLGVTEEEAGKEKWLRPLGVYTHQLIAYGDRFSMQHFRIVGHVQKRGDWHEFVEIIDAIFVTIDEIPATVQATLDEFERFIALPENADKTFELVNGEVIEIMSAPYASSIAARIAGELGMFIDDKRLGHITGENGGYVIGESRCVPNVAFVPNEALPLTKEGYHPAPPALVVEVMTPHKTKRGLRRKAETYLNGGVKEVWLVFPDEKVIEAYFGTKGYIERGVGETLDAGDLLLGFTLNVGEVFE